MKTITANDLSNVNGGAATASRPGTQNGATIWNPSAPSQTGTWQSGAASWGAKAGQAVGQAVGQWWGSR